MSNFIDLKNNNTSFLVCQPIISNTKDIIYPRVNISSIRLNKQYIFLLKIYVDKLGIKIMLNETLRARMKGGAGDSRRRSGI